MGNTLARRWHAYPRSDSNRQPTPWWYYGRALYVSRRDYFKIYWALMLALGFPLVFLGLYFEWRLAKVAALGAGTVSLFYLGYSLLGMYRMYGHPSYGYVARLLRESDVGRAAVVADIHIGTFRHSYLLADLLPDALIHSIDCWGQPDDPHEIAIRDVRDLEQPPTSQPRILTARTEDYTLPLPDDSCDAVVFGFGTHEVPNDGTLDRLFAEARRILRPNGKALMFEHGVDFHNVIIFGPVIGHVVPRYEWAEKFKSNFAQVGYARTSQAVDLFWGTKAEPIGTVSRPLPEKENRRTIWVWAVIATFTLVSLGAVAYLPESQLVAIYLAIAFLGIAGPWLMIGLALVGDLLTHSTRTAFTGSPTDLRSSSDRR